MHFTVAAAALLGMATSVFAQTEHFDSINTPEKDEVVKTGSTVKVTWTIGDEDKYGDIKVDIGVYGGKDGGSLQLVETLATGVDNSDLKYSWKVSSDLGDEKQYGIRITASEDETVYQWSPGFTIKNVSGDDDDDDSDSDDTSTGSATKTKHAASTTSSTMMTTSSSAAETTDKPSTTMAVTTSSSGEDGSSTKTGAAEETSSTPSPVPTDNAASQVGAGAVAALGGVAVALFAM